MISATLLRMEVWRQVRRRRMLFFVLLAASPVMLAVGWMAFKGQSQASELLLTLEVTMYLNLLIPFLALFFASGLVSEEVRAQPLTYLLVRPVSRLTVLLSKFAAYLVLAGILVLGSLVVTGMVMWFGSGGTLVPFDPDAPDRFAVIRATLAATGLAVFAYGAFFAGLGVFVSKPAIPGVVILVIWEGIVSASAGILKNFTVTFYLRSVVTNMTDVVYAPIVHLDQCSLARAVVTTVVFGLACLGAGWWRLSRTEFRVND